MKVIIVDDEIRVGNLIKNLIEWDELGLELIGVFQSGLDVLEQFKKEAADILISDIEMPEMSGLELVEKVTSLYPSTKCVIVSGFRNFEYARQAMKFGVDNYILKPIDEEELNYTLRSLSAAKSSEQEKNVFERENLFKSLQSESYEALDISQINNRYGYHFNEGLFFFIRIISDSEKAMEQVLSSLMSRIPLLCNDYEFYGRKKGSSYVLLDLNQSSKKDDVIKILYDCLSNVEGMYDGRFFVFVSNDFTDTKDLKKELEKVNRASWQRLFIERNGLYYISEAEPLNGKFSLSDNENNRLFKLIENNDEEGLKELVRNVFTERETVIRKDPESVCALTELLAISTFNKLYNLGVRSDNLYEAKSKIDETLEEKMSFKEVIEYVGEELWSIIKDRLTVNDDEETDYIRQAKNYIQKNYNRNISLEALADELALNQTYVSSLFKEGTGINFKQYLTDVRIDNAKKLLRETNLNLSEIAYEVGYKNAFYFTSTFTSHEGIKPQEYRKIHRSSR